MGFCTDKVATSHINTSHCVQEEKLLHVQSLNIKMVIVMFTRLVGFCVAYLVSVIYRLQEKLDAHQLHLRSHASDCQTCRFLLEVEGSGEVDAPMGGDKAAV